jgi:hypothetical protein
MKRMVLLAGLVLTGLVITGGWFAANLAMDSNGTGPRSTACRQVLTEVVSAVPGVRSVNVECRFGFGTSSQSQFIRLDAADRVTARSTAEQVLRALASSPEVDAGWQVPASFELANGTEAGSVLNDLGFGYVPVVGVVRAQWGITPER